MTFSFVVEYNFVPQKSSVKKKKLRTSNPSLDIGEQTTD
jgi:hypothetical protein